MTKKFLLVTCSTTFFFAVSLGNKTSKMSKKFRLDRKIGFQNTFYTKCINVIIDSIGPSIILRSIFLLLLFSCYLRYFACLCKKKNKHQKSYILSVTFYRRGDIDFSSSCIPLTSISLIPWCILFHMVMTTNDINNSIKNHNLVGFVVNVIKI